MDEDRKLVRVEGRRDNTIPLSLQRGMQANVPGQKVLSMDTEFTDGRLSVWRAEFITPLRSASSVDVVYLFFQDQHNRKGDLRQHPRDPDASTGREELSHQGDNEPHREKSLFRTV